MRTSERAISAIKQFEGFKAQSYTDAVGVWTIGYGSTANVKPGDVITEVEADRRLRSSLAVIDHVLSGIVRVDLTQGQWDALASFSYNLGLHRLGSSTLLKLVNSQDWPGAALEFPKWCHADKDVLPGLLKRRLEEQSWFLNNNSEGKL